eukprot:7720700-Alexandrium_andersonii.AAC.1
MCRACCTEKAAVKWLFLGGPPSTRPISSSMARMCGLGGWACGGISAPGRGPQAARALASVLGVAHAYGD